MFKPENIKRVGAQKTQTLSMMTGLKIDVDLELWTREEMAREIGMEMLRNNLIEFTTENDGVYIKTRALALVYDKNAKSEE